MLLSELITASARAGLGLQADDGSMPPGHNGPYRDLQTPLRNTGHWISIWSKAHRTAGDEAFRDAALRALRYVEGEARQRPPGGNLEFRRTGPNRCNGLIGASWMIESLLDAHAWLDSASALELALHLHGIHPFDASLGLWHAVESDGEIRSVLRTFNQQLWFAAGAARLAPHSGDARSQAEAFLDRLEDLLALEDGGRIVHLIPKRRVTPRGRNRHRFESLRRLTRAARRRKLRAARVPDERARDVGYHAFNLLGLSVLKRCMPVHPFWGCAKLRRALAYVGTPGFIEQCEGNPYAWPYNPTGFEVAAALNAFAPEEEAAAVWARRQVSRHWDPERGLMCRDSDDPETLSARLYEAASLPDLELEALDRPSA